MGFIDKIFGRQKKPSIAEQVEAAIGSLPHPVPFLTGLVDKELEAVEAIVGFEQGQMIKMLDHPEAVFVGLSDAARKGHRDLLVSGQGDPHHLMHVLKARLIGGTLRDLEWDREAVPLPRRDSDDWLMDVGEMVMLAVQARADAIATIRGVDADPEPHGVQLGLEILPGSDRDCASCKPHIDAGIREPVEMVKAGLPPFHAGCRCMVQKVPLRK